MEKLIKEEIEVQDRVSADYEKVRHSKRYARIFHAFWYRTMLKMGGKKGLVLDNGCGTGNLADLIPEKNVVGLDISKGMLSQAKKRVSKLVNASSDILPFKNASFDLIVCRSLLHHMENKEQALKEMRRVIRDDGIIVISEPIENPVTGFLREKVQTPDRFSSTHHDFRKKELVDLLSRDFRIRKIRHFGFLSYPLLGFRDIIRWFDSFPFKNIIAILLINFDIAVSYIPFIKNASWHLIIVLAKR